MYGRSSHPNSFSLSFPHSWLITGFVTRLARRMPLVEQALLTLPEHLSLSPFTWGSCYSIVSSMCMFYRLLLSFGHCLLCSSSIYGFWLLLWCLQTLLVDRCCPFGYASFGHREVCSSSIYGFWIPLWCLQTLLTLVNVACSLIFCVVYWDVCTFSFSHFIVCTFSFYDLWWPPWYQHTFLQG